MSEPSPFAEHFAAHPPAVRARLEAVRALIRAEAPAAVECISYGIPTFDLNKKHLIHFAGCAGHVGLYPGSEAMVLFDGELSNYKRAKGSVQLPHDQELPLELIRRIVQHRVAAVAKPARKKKA